MAGEDFESIRIGFGIPHAEWAGIEPYLRRATYAKGDRAVEIGVNFREIGFVSRGLFRIYHADASGAERTKAFRAEGDLVSPYAEILRGEPARSNVEALEASAVVWMPFDQLDRLARESLFWMGLLRAQAERHFLLKEQREFEFLSLSAEQQYERFVTDHPRYWQRLPQFLVASYLGITAVALSRITSRRRDRGRASET